jgi:subtilisin family serine protease
MFSVIKVMRASIGLLFCLLSATTLSAQTPVQTTLAAPFLNSVNSDGCVSAGQRLRVNGRALGSAGKFELVLIVAQQQSVLDSDSWQDTAIATRLPTKLAAEGAGVLVLRDKQNRQYASNRLNIRLCANLETATAQVTARPGSDATEASTSSVDTSSTATNPASGGGMLQPTERTAPQTSPAENDSIEAHELIVYSNNMDAARALENNIQELGYSTKRRRVLKQLGLVLTVIRIPEQERVAEALQRLQQVDNRLIADANHRYQFAGTEATASQTPQQLIKWTIQSSNCGSKIRLGLIDTLVDHTHPVLAQTKIVTKSFLPIGVQSADKRHATAIASILIGNSRVQENLRGLLPGAQLYNAGIFRRRDDDQIDTTAEMIISALDWLLSQHVHAINLSLAGSANQLLEIAIKNALTQNTVLVAAAGNNGPTAAPAYPAAWQGVVAVTAVDIKAQIYREANQGNYIAMAAPGVDIWAARAGGTWAYHSGTSYAAPYVTAAMAVLRQQHPDSPPAALQEILGQQARDLGAPGKDPVFGFGLIQTNSSCGR